MADLGRNRVREEVGFGEASHLKIIHNNSFPLLYLYVLNSFKKTKKKLYFFTYSPILSLLSPHDFDCTPLDVYNSDLLPFLLKLLCLLSSWLTFYNKFRTVSEI